MHNQPDSLFVKPDKTACIVQCHCGSGVDHGQIEFHFEKGIDPAKDPEIKWYEAACAWVNVAMPPVYGYGWNHRFYGLSTFFARIKTAWDIIMGKNVGLDFSISPQTCQELGEWLMYAAEESVYHRNTTGISLKELKEQMQGMTDQGAIYFIHRYEKLSKTLKDIKKEVEPAGYDSGNMKILGMINEALNEGR